MDKPTTPEAFAAELDPADLTRTWQQDRMHWPDPVAPAEFEFAGAFLQGIVHAAADLHLPILAIDTRHIHTFEYDSIQMAPPPASQEEADAIGRKAGEAMMSRMFDLERRWNEEQLPELMATFDRLQAEDLDGMPAPQLAQSLENRFRSDLTRACQIHMDAVLPAYVAVSEFEETYRRLVAGSTAFDAYALLSGVMNKTVEVGHELWRLSRRASPEVASLISSTPVAELVPALEASEAGRAFLADLQSYLDEYGHRGDKFGLRFPSWIDDPAPVLKNLQDFLATGEAQSPVAEHEALAERRMQAIAEARKKLESEPDDVRGSFESLLEVATFALRLTEDHGFYIDYRIGYQLRRAMMAAGRRLAADGRLDDESDVFGLTIERACEALRDPALQVRNEAVGFLAKMEMMADVSPPPSIGPAPEAPPENPFTRALGKFVGAGPPLPDTGPLEIRGLAGSPGKATGTVRVLVSLGDADKLQEGDVLVAATTAPPWTPLFATAAAVVTDTGGILSHCAVVAREYGIPCVAGTNRATAVLRDGQRVEVDGDAGVVRVLP